MLLLWSVLCGALLVVHAQDEDPREVNEYLDSVDAEPDTTILFPWFSEAVGVIVFFVSGGCV